MIRRRWLGVAAMLIVSACGVIPERVSQDDPRIKPMFAAMARVDRRAMGFTQIAREADIRLEWRSRALRQNYDAMLHVDGKTSRTVEFNRTASGYDWAGEQEIFKGPRKYDSVDGTFNEAITITCHRRPGSGVPINTVDVSYSGEEVDLAWPKKLSLDTVRPWLQKWGYD